MKIEKVIYDIQSKTSQNTQNEDSGVFGTLLGSLIDEDSSLGEGEMIPPDHEKGHEDNIDEVIAIYGSFLLMESVADTMFIYPTSDNLSLKNPGFDGSGEDSVVSSVSLGDVTLHDSMMPILEDLSNAENGLLPLNELGSFENMNVEGAGLELLESEPLENIALELVEPTKNDKVKKMNLSNFVDEEHLEVESKQSIEEFVSQIMKIDKLYSSSFHPEGQQDVSSIEAVDHSLDGEEIAMKDIDGTEPLNNDAMSDFKVFSDRLSGPVVNEDNSTVKWDNQAEFVKETVEQAKLLKDGEQTTITMKLRPESLGEVDVKMQLKDGVLNTVIVVEQMATKETLEQALKTLNIDFKNSAINIDNITLEIRSESMDLNQHFQQQERSDQWKSQRYKGKKIEVAEVSEEIEEKTSVIDLVI